MAAEGLLIVVNLSFKQIFFCYFAANLVYYSLFANGKEKEKLRQSSWIAGDNAMYQHGTRAGVTGPDSPVGTHSTQLVVIRQAEHRGNAVAARRHEHK